MSQDNQITLRGFVTAEPKYRQTAQNGIPWTEIRVGSTPRHLNRETGEWQDLTTSYYTVKCWRRLALNATASLKKGDMVVVRGRFYMREWLDNQQRTRQTLEIEADSVGHDLSYGWSHFLRGTRPEPGAQAGLVAGEAARQDLGPSGDDPYPVVPGDGGWDDPGEDGDRTGGGDGEYPAGVGWRNADGSGPGSADAADAPGPDEILGSPLAAAEVSPADSEAVAF
ncbi:MAG TPA: single-stranded DNA-binding protein [Trebonia sp.]|nr:single-stranded DNA-binding protein [Trebonia sp.]